MKTIIIFGILLTLFTLGCISPPADNSTLTPDAMGKKDDSMMKDNNTAMEKEPGSTNESGTMMKAGVTYVPFTQEAYNQANADGKTIFLEFYANWCPICKAQDPGLRSGLSKIESDNLVAFQVNYNDSETDADEQALAKKYNITYQHTHIMAGPEENVLLRSNESWSEENVIEKVGAFS